MTPETAYEAAYATVNAGPATSGTDLLHGLVEAAVEIERLGRVNANLTRLAAMHKAGRDQAREDLAEARATIRALTDGAGTGQEAAGAPMSLVGRTKPRT